MKKLCLLLLVFALAGCEPEIGSDGWCAQLKEKPRGEWALHETGDFAKHCIFN